MTQDDGDDDGGDLDLPSRGNSNTLQLKFSFLEYHPLANMNTQRLLFDHKKAARQKAGDGSDQEQHSSLCPITPS